MVQIYAVVESYIASLKDRSDEGQGLVEYALIIVLVSIVAMVGLAALGTEIDAVFGKIKTALG